MKIKFSDTANITDKTKSQSMSKKIPLAHSAFSSFNNQYEERPLKTNSVNLSFKGLSSIKVSDAVENFGEELGESAAKHLKETITRLTSKSGSGVDLVDGKLNFKDDTVLNRLNQAIIDPIIYFPIDTANASLNLLKKIPGLENSRFIDSILNVGILKNRTTQLEDFSNAMALRHHCEMLEKDALKPTIFSESQKRLDVNRANYKTKTERSVTRLVTGLIPAFFLANDAYNLSMYVNNDKDLAKKEKKRRFNQEVARVLVTAASTFAVLGYFAKKSNQDPKSAIALMTTLTFASEFIGRLMVGTPPYPITKKEAKKYAKLQHKDKLNNVQKDSSATNSKTAKNDKNTTNSTDKTKKPKADYAVRLIGALVLFGFAVEKADNIRPVRRILAKIKSKYAEAFVKDFSVSKKEFGELIDKLRKNGFGKVADKYQETVNKTLKDGNLTAIEAHRLESKMTEKAEQLMPDDFIMTSKKLKDSQKKAKDAIKKADVIKELNFAPRNDEIIHIPGGRNKAKDILINQVLGFPIKLVWEIATMPYRYVVKPLIELPPQWLKSAVSYFKNTDKNADSKAAKSVFDDKTLKNCIEFMKKHSNDADFNDKLNKTILDSFDNVNKSNFSNADLSGSAKIAVSTVTSAFLVFDNYNMVMVDTEGKDKKLAGQKAKERTIQRIIRIAYGACVIKLFNGIFKSQYNSSMLNAQAVNTASTLVTESLERTFVGLPLHEASREEIIEKDNANLNAKGFIGFYYKLMSKLTGKKPLSTQKGDKK